MNREEIILFLEKLSSGAATEVEKVAFYQSLDSLDEITYQQVLLKYQELIQASEFTEAVNPNLKQRIEESLNKWDEEDEPKVIMRRDWSRVVAGIAVAASVLLIVGLGWKFFVSGKQEAPVAITPGKTVDSAVAVIRHERNTSGREKRIQLPDGSLVVLAGRSEIAYKEPFTGQRDITLKGKAYFKVAKDKKRPFTVVSREIATTALGTEFTVTAFERDRRIIVRLYEGKVVIRPVNKGNRKLRKDVYLMPGQELVYGGESSAKAKAFQLNKAEAPEDIMNSELSRDNPSLPEDAEESWYMFNNQSLAEVFVQLEEFYNVKINYKASDVQNIYITGKFNRSDSLDFILNQISALHNLTVTRNNDTYTVSK